MGTRPESLKEINERGASLSRLLRNTSSELGFVPCRKCLSLVEEYNLKPHFYLATGYRLRLLPSSPEYVKNEFYDV